MAHTNPPEETLSFAELFEASLDSVQIQPGSIFEGLVLHVDTEAGFVTIDTPLKSEGMVRIEEFLDQDGCIEVSVGDRVDVCLEAIEDGWGHTRLSRIKAKRQSVWIELERAMAQDLSVRGTVSGRVKGGYAVDLNGIRAFLPGSLTDVRPIRDPALFEGKVLDFKLLKLDPKRSNIVVSRRSLIESELSEEKLALINALEEDLVIKGVVKNLTSYGAFVDLGGIDGLLHITDIAWRRVRHPGEVLTVGTEIEVKVLRFDQESMRVSLGLKQLGADPWVAIASRYTIGDRLQGRVTNVTEYGCFVELEEGIEGLVHVSEMDWLNRNVNPSKVVECGQEIEVMVLDVDQDRRRISLGLKQCYESPWTVFAATHQKMEKIQGKIKSITDFGIFIGLEGGVDGLVHLSDISWHLAGEEAVKQYRKGDEVSAVVLLVDPERERISLGIKQLDTDPYAMFLGTVEKGQYVAATVSVVDATGQVTLALENDLEGIVRASEVGAPVQAGAIVQACFIGVDRKNRIPLFSLKPQTDPATLAAEAAAAEAAADVGTIGSVWRAQLRKNEEENP